MIVTRGFNSKNLITRGYGLSIIYEAICIFTKNVINRIFYRLKQPILFKKDC